MLIMAEVTSEMGAELRASALAAGTSVAAEVGRRLERLDRLEASFGGVETALRTSPNGEVTIVQPVYYREAEAKAEIGMKRLRERFGGR